MNAGSPDDLGRRRLPARARSDPRGARRDGHRGAVRAGRRALRQGRRAGRRHAGAHPRRAGRGAPSRARRATGRSSRAAATPRRIVLDAAHTYCGTGSDVLYVCDPDTRERRRVAPRRRRGHGRALREAAQHRLRDEHGPAGGRAAGDRRPRPGRRDDARHAQAAAGRAARRPHPRQDEGDGGTGRRGRQLRHLRDAGAAAAVRRGRRQQGDRLRRARHPADLGAGAERRHHGAGERRGGDRRGQRRGARRPRAEPGRQAGRAVRLGRRRGRDEHADDERGVLVGGRLPRPPGADRPRALVRPAELRLRGAHRQQDARRAVERRGGAHGDPRQAHRGDAAARRRLPRVRPAEQLRVDRLRRPPARLGQGVHGAAGRGRRGAGAGRDQGRRAGRQPPGPALHAQALPADLAERPASTRPVTTPGRRTGRRRCSTACGRGSRSCAPSRAPSSSATTSKAGLDRILADVEARRPGT